MIGTLRGVVTEKLPDSLIVEIGGLGYELTVTPDDWGATPVGREAKFYIYEQVREDAYNLYGFTTLSSRQLYTQLIGVNGVGPKLAMQILGAAGESRLRQAIASGDPALLKGISGVGPKTASRVILDLRGKVEEGSAVFAPVVTLRLAGARPEHQPMLERTAEFEIVSLNGTVGHDQMHIHAAVSDTEGRVWGGHLKDGCLTKTTVELAILEDPNQDFVRRPDPATGFDELVVE
jgi:Holliday junction DNA helicase RuvA